ncbi:hypothetical protein ACHAQA_006494 [Verticillium albo-atrum]
MGNFSSGQLKLAGINPHIKLLQGPIAGRGQTIHGLFEESCSRWLYRKAVDAWDGCLTYVELDTASSKWASILASNNLFMGQKVLHVFDHSRWAIVAWFALLKAGCACIPVDTSAPEERLRSIIRGTGCKAALCDATRAPTLANLVQQVLTPAELSDMEAPSTNLSTLEDNASKASMIMYTSGSTGEPKGVIQSHGAVTSSLLRVAQALRLDETTRFLQFASHSFDVSICEIFTPLCVGGCIVVPHPGDKVGSIVNNINTMQASHALLTPTVARTFTPDEVPGLRSLSLGGERASSELRKLWASRLSLSILYGTTETAVWDTVAHISPHDCENPRLIGHPIGGRVWVVHPSNWNQLSPIGVLGELSVQGPEIGDGYLERPEQTARAFKSEPAWLPKNEESDPASQRIYRTGDMGRVLKDGSLEIWGRIDRQIKLNGQRMEPAEIEECLMRLLPSHLRVYVELLVPSQEKARLAAFVSYEENTTPAISAQMKYGDEIRKALDDVRALLPRTMIPTVVVPLTSLPLTVSKKINRRELQKMGLEFLDSARPSMAPGSQADAPGLSGPCDAQTIVRMVLDFLEPSAQQTDFTLAEAGLDSLDAVEVSTTLRRKARMHVPASLILRPGMKISDVATLAQTARPKEEPETRLQKELAQWKTKLDRNGAVDGRAVLLTGASGFLGREVLRQLLAHVDGWAIICIVRGQDQKNARDRLLTTVSQEKWWDAQFEQRIEVWCGDLAQPRLGLRHDEWRDIFGLYGRSRLIHTIIHNGAVVNWLESYESLSDPNVGSTYELLRGQLQSHDAPDLVFVSGGYISGLEETPQETTAKVCHMPGYDQTKFVSETMIGHFNSTLARGTGRIAKVFKPGFIIGSAEDGETQTRDALWRFVKACAQIGSYSREDAQKWIPVAGVDAIASMLITQMPVQQRCQTEKWFHKVLTGVYLQDIWDLLADFGLKLSAVEHHDWLRTVHSTMETEGRTHPLFPLKDWLSMSEGYMGTEPPAKDRSSDADNAEAKKAIRRSLEHLMQCGFLASGRVEVLQ